MCMDKDKEIPANIKSNIMNVLPAPIQSQEGGDSAIRELMEGKIMLYLKKIQLSSL